MEIKYGCEKKEEKVLCHKDLTGGDTFIFAASVDQERPEIYMKLRTSGFILVRTGEFFSHIFCAKDRILRADAHLCYKGTF